VIEGYYTPDLYSMGRGDTIDSHEEAVTVITLITFVFALVAFIIAIIHGLGKGGRPPLWIAVALLALGMMLPWIIGMSIR
jgi:hypothetical protein